MKRCWLGFLLASMAWAASGDGRVPVVVELFTSEGCSSCPPADALLARLERSQEIPSARVIALEEHVDYWNHLGWADPFSSPQFRARQSEFAQVFRSDDIYTPQMVVNGRAQFVGDSMSRAVTEIGRAAAQQNATVRVYSTPNRKNPELLDLGVTIADLPARSDARKFDVFLAVTEDNLMSNVLRGENAGQRLRHAAVVRSFGLIGEVDAAKRGKSTFQPTLKFPKEWKRPDLKAVVFVQDRESHQIIGADELRLR